MDGKNNQQNTCSSIYPPYVYYGGENMVKCLKSSIWESII
jgi:hypothetical protein